MAFAQKQLQPRRTALGIRYDAEQTLKTQSRFSITVRIGICNWTFTISRVGDPGNTAYTLRKGDNVITDHRPKVDAIITDLLVEIQNYI